MTATDTTYETEPSPQARLLTPAEIGALVRTVRMMQGWTQETLAEISGLQTRTVQRVEKGQGSNLDTRRALARAFRFENIDYFSSLHAFPTEETLRKEREAFDQDYLVLDAQKVTGPQLLDQMQQGPGFGSLGLMSMEELPRDARAAFAAIADFASDCLDNFDVASRSDLVSYGDAIDDLIRDLEATGFCLCAARRQMKIRNDRWQDPTPLPCHVSYLFAAAKEQPMTKAIVPRQFSIA